MKKWICVYCSSSTQLAAHYYDLATELGTQLAQRGHGLVYGAGSIGMMGAVARAVHAQGGKVVGVIPHLLDRYEVTYTACDELIRTQTMHERKAIMEAKADAFVTLPGGVGTFEELLEVITLRQLGYHTKPIIIVNAFGFYDPLLALFDRASREHFIRKDFLPDQAASLYHVSPSIADALDTLEHALLPPTLKPTVGEVVE